MPSIERGRPTTGQEHQIRSNNKSNRDISPDEAVLRARAFEAEVLKVTRANPEADIETIVDILHTSLGGIRIFPRAVKSILNRAQGKQDIKLQGEKSANNDTRPLKVRLIEAHAQHPDMSRIELARELGCNKSSITNLLSSLPDLAKQIPLKQPSDKAGTSIRARFIKLYKQHPNLSKGEYARRLGCSTTQITRTMRSIPDL